MFTSISKCLDCLESVDTFVIIQVFLFSVYVHLTISHTLVPKLSCMPFNHLTLRVTIYIYTHTHLFCNLAVGATGIFMPLYYISIGYVTVLCAKVVSINKDKM